MDRFQILCLSGGGFRGLYTASVLNHLEKHFNKKIHECFDLICGTSIGGIIATGLAFDCSAQDIHHSLVSNGSKIFTKSSKGILKSTYQATELRNAIDSLLPNNPKIEEAIAPYITTAINLHTGKPRVFMTPHHERIKIDGGLYASDVALATSAAPTFFPPAKVGDEQFVDGGLFANAPHLVGIHEAEHFLGVNINNVHILSIGTTGKIVGFGHAKQGWGKWDWIKKGLLLELTFSSQQEFATNIAMHRLGDRFVKIDETHSNHQSFSSSMDDASQQAIEQLESMANRSIMHALNNDTIKSFFNHQPNRNGLEYNFTNNSEAA